MYNGNENVIICDHPLIKHKITRLRDKTTGTNEEMYAVFNLFQQ